MSKKKILFVCTVNRMRSATAHEMYKSDERFEVRSAGTNQSAEQVITRDLINWADTVIVMEKHHRNTIRKTFPDLYLQKTIVCLYIPDEYDYMDEVLQGLIEIKFEDLLRRGLA